MAGRETHTEEDRAALDREQRFDREGVGAADAREGYAGGGRAEGRRGWGGGAGGSGWVMAILAIIAAGLVAWLIAAWVADDDEFGVGFQNATVQDIVNDPGDWYGEFVTVTGRIVSVGPSAPATGAAATGQQAQGAQGGQQAEGQQAQGGQQAEGQQGQGAQQPQDQQGQGLQGQQQAQGQQGGALAFTLVPAGQAVDNVDTGEQLLVVDAQAQGLRPVEQGNLVQVTGVVRAFGVQTFNEVFGGDGDGLFDGGFFDDFEGQPVVVATSLDPTVGIIGNGGGNAGGGNAGGGGS